MQAYQFYALFIQIPKLDAREKLDLVAISSLPHMDQADKRRIIQMYRLKAYDVVELIKEDDDFTNIHRLRKALSK